MRWRDIWNSVWEVPRTHNLVLAGLVAALPSVAPPPLVAATSGDSRTRLLGDAGYGDRSSPLANPAAMVERDYFQLTLSSHHEPGNRPGGQYLGIIAPLKSVTDQALSMGVFGDWAEDGLGPDPRSGFQGLERTYQAGYAFRMPGALPFAHQLAFGANVFRHDFGPDPGDRESDWGMDAGLHWNPWYSSRKGELYLDAALHNVLSPFGVDTIDGKRRRAQPLDFNGSLLWRNPLRNLDLQAGLLVQDINRETGTGRSYLPGGGVIWHPGRDWQLELGYHPLGFPQVGGAYRIFKEGTLQVLEIRSHLSHARIHIGVTGSLFTRKEQWIFPARYRRLHIEPEDAHLEANRLFHLGKYYLAAQGYGKMLSKYPSHLYVDSASFALGICFRNLGLHELARETFAGNLRKFSDGNHTRLIADNMRELLRVEYLLGDYDSALVRDSLFRELFPRSPFMPTFDYFSAQMKFSRGEFAEALPRYAAIPKGHRYYPQARHNLALCHFKMDDRDRALEILSDLLEDPALGDVDRDLRESARTKLGMLRFRSDPALAEALLEGIGPRSAYRDEAHLVRAWLAVRRSDFPRVDELSALIMDSLPRSVVAKEACLLRAYAAYRMGRNPEARRFADSVLAGDWSDFFLPEEKALLERANAEYDAYDSLQEAFHLEVMRVRVKLGCYRDGIPTEATLEEYRQRHIRAAELRNTLGKAERYARSRGQVETIAERVKALSVADP